MYRSCPKYNPKISWKSKGRKKILEAFQEVEIKDKPHLEDELKLYSLAKSVNLRRRLQRILFLF